MLLMELVCGIGEHFKILTFSAGRKTLVASCFLSPLKPIILKSANHHVLFFALLCSLWLRGSQATKPVESVCGVNRSCDHTICFSALALSKRAWPLRLHTESILCFTRSVYALMVPV